MSSVDRKYWLSILCVIVMTSCIMAADQPAPVQKAIDMLAQKLNVGAAEIKVASVEGVDWPDTSLGAPQPGMVYLQVIMPGYKVVLEAQGKRYEYHTDMKARAVLASIDGERVAAETAPQPAPTEAPPAVAQSCREDLAKRLNIAIDEIRVSRVEAVEFPDASLGLPRPGEMYAQMITPGQIIHLIAENIPYLYTTAGKTCRYGGPLQARLYSALYLEPVQDEANMNGNLLQVSLAGTNPTTLITGVSDFRPQENGGIIAKRRTSRSGHDLLYLAPGQSEEIKLASGLDFGDAAVNVEGTQWAAVARPMLGAAWQVSWGTVGGETPGHVDLPAGAKPGRVYWHMPNPVVGLQQDGGVVYHELTLNADKPACRKLQGFFPPPTEEFMLNKSETLEVRTITDAGKTITRVSKRWFTGDDKPVAAIANFTPAEMSLTPDKRFLLLSGQQLAVTVDLRTGEIIATAEQVKGPVRLLVSPPQGWLWSHLAEAQPEE